jgi:hypothetical protein
MDTKSKFQIFIIIILLSFIGFITYLFMQGESIIVHNTEDSSQILDVVFNKDSYIEGENSVSGNPVINDKSLSLDLDLQGEQSFYEGQIDIDNKSEVDVYLKSIDLSIDDDLNYYILYNDKDYNSLTDNDRYLPTYSNAYIKIRIEPKEIIDEVKETKINISIKYTNKNVY